MKPHFLPCIILTITMSLLLCNCSEDRIRGNLFLIKEFPHTINLKGSSITEVSDDFYPLQLGIKDSILIFCDWENSPHFHLYKIPEFEFIASFGKRGRGPSELIDPVFWGQTGNSESNKIWIYQLNARILSLLDIDKTINASELITLREVILPYEILDAVNIIAAADDVYIGTGVDVAGDFFIYNALTGEFKWKEFYMDYDKKFSEELIKNQGLLHEYKRGIIKIKPDNSRFVKAYIYAPVIDIFNIEGSLDFTIMLKDYKTPSLSGEMFDMSTMVYYENVFLSNDYIYALSRNCNFEEYSMNECNNAEIHVYNWKGEPVCNYRLNEGIAPIAPFVVDEKNKKIYTVNPKSDEDFFSLFDLDNTVLFKQ